MCCDCRSFGTLKERDQKQCSLYILYYVCTSSKKEDEEELRTRLYNK